jgi:hypothetical protein
LRNGPRVKNICYNRGIEYDFWNLSLEMETSPFIFAEEEIGCLKERVRFRAV